MKKSRKKRPLWRPLLAGPACIAIALTGAARAHEEDRGAKAAALGNAFVAQADDPSAVAYNPAGLAFQDDRAISIGFSVPLISRSRFVGFDPVPGSGEDGSWRIEHEPSPHVFWIEPVAARWAVGLAFGRAEGFEFDWRDGESWAGRFESRRSGLSSWELASSASMRVHRSLGLSAGLRVRATRFTWRRHEVGFNPASSMDEEIGLSEIGSDFEIGYGAVIGVLYRPDGRWSFGLRWRSGVRTELDGHASFVQIPSGDAAFDGLAAGLLPFGQAVGWRTRIRQPERLAFGTALALTPNALIEIDLERIGWSAMNGWAIEFDGFPMLARSPVDGWESRLHTRIGLRWNGLGNGEWRAGLYREPTPQPEQGLGPFFVGADRLGAAIGYGTRVERLQTDVALVWEERGRRSTRSHGFDGRYTSRVVRLVLTFGW